MIPLLEAATVAWPCALTIACAVAVERRREGRRRVALNRALHELRRPLQLIALTATPFDGGRRTPAGTGVHLAAALAALTDLEGEINGQRSARRPLRIDAAGLVADAVSRWREPAARHGRDVELRWRAPDAEVIGDPQALARALDNVIANSLEHGSGRLRIEGRAEGRWLRVAIADGDPAAGSAAVDRAGGGSDRPGGREIADPRRGHGLAIVAGVAAACGGRFAFSPRRAGALAVLELPLAAGAAEASNGTRPHAA